MRNVGLIRKGERVFRFASILWRDRNRGDRQAAGGGYCMTDKIIDFHNHIFPDKIALKVVNMDTTLPSGCPLLVRNFEVLANINSVYILNSSLSGTMTIPGSYDMGAVVNTNTSTGTIANVVSNVNIQLNSAGYHKYATDTSCGVSFWVYL